TAGMTVTQALDSWLAKRARDDAPPRKGTIDGHRQRVKALTDFLGGDLPLTAIDRAKASAFLASLTCSNGTRNQYVMTLKTIFENASTDGAFPHAAENPWNKQRRDAVREKRLMYTDAQAVALFDAFGPRVIEPSKHTVETALPWAVLISAHSALGLEEVCQLQVSDVQTIGTNGASVTVLDIHNGDKLHSLKN